MNRQNMSAKRPVVTINFSTQMTFAIGTFDFGIGMNMLEVVAQNSF